MAKTVSEVFVETLIEAGVKRFYGVVGDSLNCLTDAMRKSMAELSALNRREHDR